jgi:HNH endonuclease
VAVSNAVSEGQRSAEQYLPNMRSKMDADARCFASLLKHAKLARSTLRFGNFVLHGSAGVEDAIQYNRRADVEDLLGDVHEYSFPFGANGSIQVSLQLYLNVLKHYRLFAYTRVDKQQGMTFSVNLTTKKESANAIFLEQALRFSERHPGDINVAAAVRRQKQLLLSDILRRCGMEVDDDFRLLLGVFNPVTGAMLNTTPEDFLNNFLCAALLKGHFQGNKGYELDMLPSARLGYDLFAPAETAKVDMIKRKRDLRLRRTIPLAIRCKVLTRDKSSCRRCGRVAGSGLVLHVDHMTPVSRGGDNSLKNLWTLCGDCNLGKGNRFVDGLNIR